MQQTVGDAQDALTAVWLVAGEDLNAWNEAAAAAESDDCESQKTVCGL